MFFYEINLVLLPYHRKITQKCYIASWQNQFKRKTKQPLCADSDSNVDLPENKRIGWVHSFIVTQ